MSDVLKKEIIEVIKDLLDELFESRRLDRADFQTLDIVKDGYDMVDKLEDM